MAASSSAEHFEALLHDVHEGPTIDALPTVVHAILDGMERGRAGVTVVRQNPQLGTQIARLRWMFPDGRTPFILMPSRPEEYFELMSLAVAVAAGWTLPVVLTVEQELADAVSKTPPKKLNAVPIFDAKSRADAVPLWQTSDGAIRRWQGLVHGNAEKLERSRLDADNAGDVKRDWLVISYGHTAVAAQEAVGQARGKGLGVDHLVLQSLSPVTERAIAKAAMGKRFVVVAERNTGQIHADVQRLCPSLPCVLVQSAIAPVRPDQVLDALLKFPRCC
jgi:pyruvate/2-oxoacid:ferredoxin oxidoreductase alpha subunit